MHAGVAPIAASSGQTSRYRLARGGNRQLNAALHRIALTQIRLGGPGRAYYQQRPARGNTKMEALRALQRRLARVVFGRLQHATGTLADPPTAASPMLLRFHSSVPATIAGAQRQSRCSPRSAAGPRRNDLDGTEHRHTIKHGGTDKHKLGQDHLT